MAPSTYYDTKARGPSQRAQRDAELGPTLAAALGRQLPRLRCPQAVESRTSGRPRRGP